MAVDGMGLVLLPLNPSRPNKLRGNVEEERERDAPDWAAIRAEYESRRGALADIARRHGTSLKTLNNRAAQESWVRRNVLRTTDRGGIIARLFRVLDRQIVQLEMNMTETGEKEVAVLGKLASTLEKLIEIEKSAKAERPAAQHKDIEDLREKLARRIAQLKRV